MLIEQGKFGRVVKRLFTGSTAELLGEILQNAQRAGAKTIDFIIDIAAGTLTITDDGGGLAKDAGAAAQFLPVVTIAQSEYANAQVADQDPMGVGCFSIIANDAVSSMKIASNHLELTLPSEEVWTAEFWNDWQKRVAASDFDKGFRLTICATSKFAEHAANLLRGIRTPRENEPYEVISPARGYEDFLRVNLNGEAVNTSLPDKVKNYDVIIGETEFDGSPLVIGYNKQYQYSSFSSWINWYGQLINTTGINSSAFNFYLHVRKGTPVNPKSPTRNGIIKDAKSDALLELVRGEIRRFVLNPANRPHITEQFLRALESCDREWFLKDCPYFVAASFPYEDSPENGENFESGKDAVFTYDDAPQLLESDIELGRFDGGEDDEIDSYQSGISTFEPQIGVFYVLTNGNAERLAIKRLYWRVGAKIDDFFYEKGYYALLDAKNADPQQAEWLPLTCAENVYAFNTTENWDIHSAEDLVVGTNGTLQNRLDFFNAEAWAVWSSENDEASWEEMEDSFRKSLETAKSNLFADTIEDDTFDMWQIKLRFGIKDEEIRNIEFLTDENRLFGAAVTTATGKTVKKVFLSRRINEGAKVTEKLAA